MTQEELIWAKGTLPNIIGEIAYHNFDDIEYMKTVYRWGEIIKEILDKVEEI